MLTRYCSKDCQKDAWETGHRNHCRMLRSALGQILVLCIRKALSDGLTRRQSRCTRDPQKFTRYCDDRVLDM